MGKDTKIQWADSTVNPVMGCDGCELWNLKGKSPVKICYAGTLTERYGGTSKGFPESFDKVTLFPGRMAEAAKWPDLRGAKRPGKPWLDGCRRLIFLSDMGDALSEFPGMTWSEQCVWLHREIIVTARSESGSRHVWLWLTKRPGRVAEMMDRAYRIDRKEWPSNLWVGTSVTGETTISRVAALRNCYGVNKFVSFEPQLERVSDEGANEICRSVHWVLHGGQSGTGSAEFYTGWAKTMHDKCKWYGVPYFLKQLGASAWRGMDRLKLKDSHGGDWDEWPEDLRVREVPKEF